MKKVLLLGSFLALISTAAHAETKDIMNPFYQVKQWHVQSSTSYEYKRTKLKNDEDAKAFEKLRTLTETVNVGLLDQLSLDLKASRVRKRSKYYTIEEDILLGTVENTIEKDSSRYHNLGFGLTGKIIDNDQFKLQGSVSFLSVDDNQERNMNYNLKFGYQLNEKTTLYVDGSFTDGKDRDTKSGDPNTDNRIYNAEVGAYTKIENVGLSLGLGYTREHSLYHDEFNGNDNTKYYYLDGKASYQFNDNIFASAEGKYSFHEKFSSKGCIDEYGDYIEGNKLKNGHISNLEVTLSVNVLF